MNANAELNHIATVDLDSIKAKLMENDGEGWTQQRVDAVEGEYRRFLCLMKLYPREETAPPVDVDTFWHYHILDTMKYAVDCEQIFGYFLHHAPYSGPRGDADQARHDAMGARTAELYRATFGEGGISQDGAWCQATTAWCQATTANAAWCQATAASSAWCQATVAKSAWCQATVAKSAWCQATVAKSAWCQATVAKSAWCQATTSASASPARVAAWPQSPAQNSSIYTFHPVLAEAA